MKIILLFIDPESIYNFGTDYIMTFELIIHKFLFKLFESIFNLLLINDYEVNY